MPYHMELGSDGHSFHGKAIVVNTKTGEHKSLHPIPLEKAKAQMRILEDVAHKEHDPPKHHSDKHLLEEILKKVNDEDMSEEDAQDELSRGWRHMLKMKHLDEDIREEIREAVELYKGAEGDTFNDAVDAFKEIMDKLPE